MINEYRNAGLQKYSGRFEWICVFLISPNKRYTNTNPFFMLIIIKTKSPAN